MPNRNQDTCRPQVFSFTHRDWMIRCWRTRVVTKSGSQYDAKRPVGKPCGRSHGEATPETLARLLPDLIVGESGSL